MSKKITQLFRIDNFNRIIVLVSMILFLIYPSIVLYNINPSNGYLDTILPCLVVIGLILGSGIFSLVRSLRVPFFYFLEMLIVLPIELYDFAPQDMNLNINVNAIVWCSIVYSLVALLINVVVFIRYWKKNSNAYLKEDTNSDTIYDFLNAERSNEKIEDDLEQITNNEKSANIMKRRKEIKLSKALRVVSFTIIALMSLIYLLICIKKGMTIATSEFARLNLETLVILPIVFFFSLFYPRDFKYLYFYHGILFLIFDMVSSENVKNIYYILGIIVLVISFIITLIVEGRTWMGADLD